MGRFRPPVKTHGGKSYLCPWIIDTFPAGYENLDYYEVFAGGASVLLNKQTSQKEYLNDLDKPTVAVWKTIRDNCDQFQHALSQVTYTEETFNAALESKPEDEFNQAVNEYILRRMSRGGMKKAFAWSTRLRGGKPGDQNSWETMLVRLGEISDRIKNVTIYNDDFRPIMEMANHENSLIYLDPPYLKATRAKGSTEIYSEELDNKSHIDLARACLGSRAKVILSGYPSELYQELFGGWRCLKRGIANHSSQAKGKQNKTECLWLNF